MHLVSAKFPTSKFQYNAIYCLFGTLKFPSQKSAATFIHNTTQITLRHTPILPIQKFALVARRSFIIYLICLRYMYVYSSSCSYSSTSSLVLVLRDAVRFALCIFLRSQLTTRVLFLCSSLPSSNKKKMPLHRKFRRQFDVSQPHIRTRCVA